MIPFSGERPHRQQIPILFVDLEGGFGGSSRSLFFMVEHLDRERFKPVVLVRKKGPILERYRAIRVCTHVDEKLPSFRPGLRKRPVSFAFFLLHWIRFLGNLRSFKGLLEDHRIELLHVNHESLGLTGYFLSRLFRVPWVCHIRTLLVQSFFSRMVYKVINRHANRVVFITDQNLTHFAAIVGKNFSMSKAAVVRNIMPEIKLDTPLTDLQGNPDLFKVLSMSNFSPNRGIDRILDVAECLKRMGRNDFSFFLFGRPAHQKMLTGKDDPYSSQLRARVMQKGLEGMVIFPGHTGKPESALAGGDALIKLTREANPWGRDIMEAMKAGLPVITLGAYEGFVEHGVNGYLALQYKPDRIADFLIRLKDEPLFRNQIGTANRAKASRLFDGKTNASLFHEIYSELLVGRRARMTSGKISHPVFSGP